MTGFQWDGVDGSVWDLMNGAVALSPGVMGLDEPETVFYGSSSPLLDGFQTTGNRHPERRVFWPLVIPAASSAAWLTAHRAFKNSLSYSKYGRFTVTLDGEEGRYILLRLGSQSDPGLQMDPEITTREMLAIEMIADDPWWKGPDVSKTFQTAEDLLPFYAVTSDRVFNLMSSNTVDTGDLENPGDVPAWPIYQIDGPAESFFVGDGGNWHVGGSFDVGADEWLIVNSDPRVQTATLFHSEFFSEDVTDQLTDPGFGAVPTGSTSDLNIVLEGAGSMTITIVPRYFRAF